MGKTLIRNFQKILIMMILAWICAFITFIIDALHFPSNIIPCSNVVVLTGAAKRIPYAFSFIKTGKIKNIFISGVYEKTNIEDLLAKKDEISNVKIILGKSAKNTNENAKEIADWVYLNSINELTFITSDYHMRRSIVELKNRCPDLLIHPAAVKSENYFFFIWTCFKEFHKTCYAYFRNIIYR